MEKHSRLVTVDEALQLGQASNLAYHQRHLNPRLASLLEMLGLNQRFTHAYGPYIWDDQGNQYLDFLCGYGALNLGHNHPKVCESAEKLKGFPSLSEGVNPLAGALAHNLATLAPGPLQRVYFANSGAEVVDASLKLVRAATGRAGLVACQGGFHGRTMGALSVTHRSEYREPFAPLLPAVKFVPYGDSSALEKVLRRRKVAGFLVEPILGEGGFVVPPSHYLSQVRDLCTRYGTLLIVDEVQTGLGRTGTLFAVEQEGITPDVLLLGKSLGGGLMPLSALLTTDPIFEAARGASVYTPFHTSTFGGNPRACAAGIATLEVLLADNLSRQAAESGEYLRDRLRNLQSRQPLIAEIRGRGLMMGIAFAPATQGLRTVLTGGWLNRMSRMYFSSLVMMRLLQKYHILTAFTLNEPNVLRLQPPLTIEQRHLDYVVAALEETLQVNRSFAHAAWEARHQLRQVLLDPATSNGTAQAVERDGPVVTRELEGAQTESRDSAYHDTVPGA